MSTFELKTEPHNLVNEYVGFTSANKPLTKQEFIKRIEKAEAQIRKGQSVTIEELEKESQSW